MTTNTYYRAAFIATLTLTLSSLAFAHGKKEHSDDTEMPEYDAVSNEFGSYEAGLTPAQTVNVSMADTMRFTPSSLVVKAGEVVRFVVTNDGLLQHEFVLGTPQTLSEHNEMMKKFPGMEHEEPNMLLLEPSAKGGLIWKFTEAGTVDFACLQPGHYDAGMKGSVLIIN